MDARVATPVELAEGFRGELLRPADKGYEEARGLFNAMIDRHPALIARCVDVADVIEAVRHARAEGLRLAIRGGGHNRAGLGSCDGGLVVDLSAMGGTRVDPDARTVRAEGGCKWGDVDHATHAFGLATPSGIISTTGVGGLTLGGGIGYLAREYGLSIDNLLGTVDRQADGSLVRASEEDHSDLFWAIRGGGGNFGVVTSFLFRLHPVDTIIGGPMLWPLERSGEVMRWYREFLPAAPRQLGGFFAFLVVPPADPFPEAHPPGDVPRRDHEARDRAHAAPHRGDVAASGHRRRPPGRRVPRSLRPLDREPLRPRRKRGAARRHTSARRRTERGPIAIVAADSERRIRARPRDPPRAAPAARIVVGDTVRTPAPSDSIEIASEMPATPSPSRTQRLDI